MHGGAEESLKYPLENLNALLHFSQSMSVKVPHLLRYTAQLDVTEEFGKAIDAVLSSKAQDRQKQIAIDEIVTNYLSRGNTDLFWGEMIKNRFQSCDLHQRRATLDYHLKYIRRMAILLHELKPHLVEFFKAQKASSDGTKIDFNYKGFDFGIAEIFLQYIGQLIKDDQEDAAKAIHNFLHLMSRIAFSRPEEECMRLENNERTYDKKHAYDVVALSVGPCLLGALDLKGALCGNHFTGKQLANEFHFMRAFCFILLQHSQFTNPYASENYQTFCQPPEYDIPFAVENIGRVDYKQVLRLNVDAEQLLAPQKPSRESFGESLSNEEAGGSCSPLFKHTHASSPPDETGKRRSLLGMLSPRSSSKGSITPMFGRSKTKSNTECDFKQRLSTEDESMADPESVGSEFENLSLKESDKVSKKGVGRSTN